MKLKCDFKIQEICGTFMAVPVGKKSKTFSGVINLNASGKRMFELILEGKSEDEIIVDMLNEYDVDDVMLRSSLNDLIGKLKAENLIAEE